jgi:hypothetical protein
MHSCPECGAETPLVSGLEQSSLHFSTRAGFPHSETAATINLSEGNKPQSKSQSLPLPVSATRDSHLIQSETKAPNIPSDAQTRSPRTGLVIALSVTATVCVVALGFIVVRAWLDKKRETKQNTEISTSTGMPMGTISPVDRPTFSDYATYNNSTFNYSIEYPENILIPISESESPTGKRFSSSDGQSELTVMGLFNRPGETAEESYQSTLSDYSKRGRVVTYKVLRENWYVISGFDGGRVFYEKTIFNSGMIKLFRFEWPESQRSIYEQITNRISKTFTG